MFRFIKNANFINLENIDQFALDEDKFSMFKLCQQIGNVLNLKFNNVWDSEIFKRLRCIISQLVLVKPEDRLKLKDASKKLEELDNFISTNGINDFVLLESFFRKDDPQMQNTQHSSQTLTSSINADEFFTLDEDPGGKLNLNLPDDEKLYYCTTDTGQERITQKNTNLCVPISAMRLLSFAILSFLQNHLNHHTLEDIKKIILNFPKKRKFKNVALIKDAPKESFIQKLVTICCGVISPRWS